MIQHGLGKRAMLPRLRNQRKPMRVETLEPRQLLSVSSIEVDKFLWDINGNPNLHNDIRAGDELIYAFRVTNTGETQLRDISLDDSLPGLVLQEDVVTNFTAYEQSMRAPEEPGLGPFASFDRTLPSDPFEAKAWDNFSLSSATVIDGLSWYGAYVEPFATGPDAGSPETDFVVEVFADDAGRPGSRLHDFHLDGGLAGVDDANVRTTLLGHTAEDGGPAYHYSALLPFTALDAGDYWISITAAQTFPSPTLIDPTWQWHLGTRAGGDDGFLTFDDTFDDPGDADVGLVDTTPRPAVEASQDLAFAIQAAELVDFGGMLEPGESVVFMGTYIVTQDDVQAGEVVNEATVSANDPSDAPVTDSDQEVVRIDRPETGIEIDKFLWDINGSPDLHNNLKVGDELIYSFNVTNVGATELTNVQVSDPLPGLVMDDQVARPYTAYDQPLAIPGNLDLGPFASVDRTLPSDPFEAKAWDNFSVAAFTVLDGVSWAGAYIEPFAEGPGILDPETDFLIEIAQDELGLPGSVVHSFEVHGGTAGVDDANVVTTRLGHTAAEGGPVFAYDAMLPFTALFAGDYWISITALQTFPNEAPTIDPTWQWHLGTNLAGADGFYTYDDTFDDPGDAGAGLVDGTPRPVNFEEKDLAFTIHASELVDFDGSLAPGDSVMFMGTYIVTAQDVVAGQIVNTATATADTPLGFPVDDSDQDIITIDRPETGIEIDKFLWDINGSPDLHNNLKVGDELIYSFNVTNVGATELTNVQVSDPLPGLVMDEQVARPYTAYDQPLAIPGNLDLGPFASVDRTLPSDPFEAKAWDNFSVAAFTVLDGVSWAGAYIEPFAEGPGILDPETDFLIEIAQDELGLPGSVVHSFEVHGGTAGVDDANVVTTRLGHTAAEGGPVFAYDAMLPFTALFAGDYWISITALQTFPNEAPTIDPTWQWHLGTNLAGADGFYTYDDTFDDPGDAGAGLVDGTPRPVNFEEKDLAFTIHASELVDFDGSLAPGDSVMFMGTYIVTAQDVVAGQIVNTATATADTPLGFPVDDSDQDIITIDRPETGIEIDKFLWDINGSPDLHNNLKVGDELIYSFNVTNVGATELTNVQLSDPLPGLVMQPEVLEPFVAYEQTLAIPSNLDLGPFASVDRTLPSDPFEAKAWDNFSLSEAIVLDGIDWAGAYIEPFAEGAGIARPETDFLVEISLDDGGLPGDVAHSFELPAGIAGINDPRVTTTLLGHTASAGGPSYRYEAILPFTVLEAGNYWLSITALQTFPNANAIDPTWQWHIGTNAGGADGFYAYDDTFDDPGDNDNGLVDGTPYPAAFFEKDLAFALHASRETAWEGVLGPGQQVMFMGTYEVTQEDVDLGEIANKATVTGVLPSSEELMDMDEHLLSIHQSPAVTLAKHTNGHDADDPKGPVIGLGELVTWTFDVTNTGNVTLTEVTVHDDAGPAPTLVAETDAGSDGLLSPGEVWTFESSAAATLGQYANLGTVTAKAPQGETVEATDPSHYFGCNQTGDINGDGIVDFPDFLTLAFYFGAENATPAMGDINCDGRVDFPDFLILAANFGKRFPPTAPAAASTSGTDAAFAVAAADEDWRN